MKLSEHVNTLRVLIQGKFDKQFARLGLGKAKPMAIESVPEALHDKRQRYSAIIENHIGETGDYVRAREKLLDELTFTLFNRLAALKVMEAANLFPPVLTRQPEHGDRSFGHKAWLEIYPDMRNEELEGIREYIKHAFDELGNTLPLFSRTYPYALLPDAISLNEIIDAFNAVEKDPQVGSDIWESDDVLGWLYESYNTVKKKAHKDSKEKTEYDKVYLQSQVYTPRWVVQFLVENSLGKLYLEMYPSSDIRNRYKIANAPQAREREPKPLHEIKMIDPTCGSGNMLLYGFDFFYDLYMDQIDNFGAEYDEDEIPKLIIENNLHGIDLDDRAVQLAQLGLYIKARKKRTTAELKFKIVSSDFFLPDYDTVRHIFEQGTRLDPQQQELIQDIWEDLIHAYKFGSLIRLNEKLTAKLKALIKQRTAEQLPLFPEEHPKESKKAVQMDLFNEENIRKEKEFYAAFIRNLKIAVEKHLQTGKQSFLSNKTRDAVVFLEVLTTEYDVAVSNPPYTDGADLGPELKKFVEENYKKPYKFHTNLYATFIKRCYELTKTDGKIAMIHPHTFMFIKTFEDVRKFMIERCHIDAMADFGLDRVNLFGPGILLDATFYILSKIKSENEGLYFNLTTNLQEKFKKNKFLEALNDFIDGVPNERVYTLEQSKLKIIKSWPFIYWISDEFREKFGGKALIDVLSNCPGLQTSNNNRFVRYMWEIFPLEERISGAKWFPYAKGGGFQKWFGNMWLIVNYENEGSEIKEYVINKYPYLKGNPTYVVKNEEFYFREGVTYSASGSKGPSFRYLQKGAIFDVGGSCIFPNQHFSNISYMLGAFNSKLTNYILNCLNPTVNVQAGDISRLPFVVPDEKHSEIISELSDRNVTILERCKSFIFYESSFEKSPIASFLEFDYKTTLRKYYNYENHLLTQVLINEAIINAKIFEVYDLTEHDKAMVLAKEGESIGGLPVLPEAREAYLSETEATKEFPLDNIKNFINSLPTRDFTAEERNTIEKGFPTLYQSNNHLEEFCIRHQVNPINVWYWFKHSDVIPKQRMHTLAMEFLADMIREILMEDEDGIIPLVTNAGDKILVDRIEDKFREKGFTTAQFAGFDSVLGRPIPDYLNRFFFAELSDHLNLFMYLPKTPFIWHLSSGPEQGFDCYIIIYKWSRDKLLRLRSVYIENRERALVNRQSDLADNDSAEAQNEKDRIGRQLREIEDFKTKIDDLLSTGYDPILDDGVGKNIAPLQKRQMIPYEVLNPGQLKKYLNADW
jgi:hypothetical protein